MDQRKLRVALKPNSNVYGISWNKISIHKSYCYTSSLTFFIYIFSWFIAGQISHIFFILLIISSRILLLNFPQKKIPYQICVCLRLFSLFFISKMSIYWKRAPFMSTYQLIYHLKSPIFNDWLIKSHMFAKKLLRYYISSLGLPDNELKRSITINRTSARSQKPVLSNGSKLDMQKPFHLFTRHFLCVCVFVYALKIMLGALFLVY